MIAFNLKKLSECPEWLGFREWLGQSEYQSRAGGIRVIGLGKGQSAGSCIYCGRLGKAMLLRAPGAENGGEGCGEGRLQSPRDTGRNAF